MTAETIALIVAAIAGTGGIAALFKLRGENSKIFVDAAQGAVIVTTTVITALREQNADQAERLKALEARQLAMERTQSDLDDAQKQIASVTLQRDALLKANEELIRRVEHLEEQVDRLQAQAGRTT